MRSETLNSSVEVLTHYNCKACGKWWTIGDHFVILEHLKPKVMYCPHCGFKHSMTQDIIGAPPQGVPYELD